MKLIGKSTLAVLASAFAVGLMPKPTVAPSAWVAENLILADGPHAGEKWDPAQTPYAAEILDCLSPEHPANVITVRKSAQVGLTTLGMGWVGYVEDQEPASGMTVFPTILSVQDYNRDKLQPTIDASRRASKGRKWRIIEQSSRSARGSTAMSKKFTGGIWTLTGANSTSDLRSKTRRFINCEEIDEWEFDLAGQGDPMGMVDARQIAFHTKASPRGKEPHCWLGKETRPKSIKLQQLVQKTRNYSKRSCLSPVKLGHYYGANEEISNSGTV